MKNKGQWEHEFGGFIKDEGLELSRLPSFLDSDDWEDESWHNDECPRFTNHKLCLELWVNFKSPKNNGMELYGISRITPPDGEFVETLLSTDFLCEVNRFVEKEERIYRTKMQKLAKAFSANIRKVLDRAEMRDLLRRNAAQKDPKICHTHDFMDANVEMGFAFEKVLGREPNPSHDCDAIIWNEAWALAKAKKFFWR